MEKNSFYAACGANAQSGFTLMEFSVHRSHYPKLLYSYVKCTLSLSPPHWNFLYRFGACIQNQQIYLFSQKVVM